MNIVSEQFVSQTSATASIFVDRVVHNHRKVPLSRGKHIRGFHPVNPTHGSVAFESLLEFRVIDKLIKFPGFRRIRPQPFTIFFILDGTSHRYTPDFLVEFEEVPLELEMAGFEKQTLVEVKRDAAVAEERNKIERNFRAVQIAGGPPIRLITEGDLVAGDLEVRDAIH